MNDLLLILHLIPISTPPSIDRNSAMNCEADVGLWPQHCIDDIVLTSQVSMTVLTLEMNEMK